MNKFQVLLYETEASKGSELMDALELVVNDLNSQMETAGSEIEKLPKRVDFFTSNNNDCNTFVVIALVELGDLGIPTNWNPPPPSRDILLTTRTGEFILEFIPERSPDLAFSRP